MFTYTNNRNEVVKELQARLDRYIELIDNGAPKKYDEYANVQIWYDDFARYLSLYGKELHDQKGIDGTMTILRAVKEKEMDVDIEEQTTVQAIDRDSPEQITLYGTEKNGKLWYIVLSQLVVDRIKST